MNAAETAQRIRHEVLSWPDVQAVHGPLLQRPGQYFLRFVYADGTSYSVELVREEGEK